MHNESINRAHLLRLYTWVARPRSVHNLKLILRRLTEAELLYLINDYKSSPVAAKIAWTEFGSRRGFISVVYRMREHAVLEVAVEHLVLATTYGSAVYA
jgi:hypothetical protein